MSQRREYTSAQRRIIERYYDQRDVIALQNLQQLVGDLFLAQADGKRTERMWMRVQRTMTALKVPTTIVDHVLKSRDAQLLARHVTDWLTQAQQTSARQTRSRGA